MGARTLSKGRQARLRPAEPVGDPAAHTAAMSLATCMPARTPPMTHQELVRLRALTAELSQENQRLMELLVHQLDRHAQRDEALLQGLSTLLRRLELAEANGQPVEASPMIAELRTLVATTRRASEPE